MKALIAVAFVTVSLLSMAVGARPSAGRSVRALLQRLPGVGAPCVRFPELSTCDGLPSSRRDAACAPRLHPGSQRAGVLLRLGHCWALGPHALDLGTKKEHMKWIAGVSPPKSYVDRDPYRRLPGERARTQNPPDL